MVDSSSLYREKLSSAAQAAAMVPISSTLAVAMGAGAPPALLQAIADRVRSDDLISINTAIASD